MSLVDVKRPVTVKVIMTPGFREQLIQEARETITRIEENLSRLQEETHKQIVSLNISNPSQASMLTQELETEKERFTRMKAELEWRIREVEGVQDGAELPFRIFEGSVTLNVGDNFLEKMSATEVVLKDWIVVEIRQK